MSGFLGEACPSITVHVTGPSLQLLSTSPSQLINSHMRVCVYLIHSHLHHRLLKGMTMPLSTDIVFPALPQALVDVVIGINDE